MKQNHKSVVDESIKMLEEIGEKEKNIDTVVNKVNESVRKTNQIIDWFGSNYTKVEKHNNKKDHNDQGKYTYIIEYSLLYISILFTMCAMLNVFTPFNAELFVKISMALTSCILIGVIKDILWKMVKGYKLQSEHKDAVNRALETAVTSLSIQSTKKDIQNAKLVKYIREKDPMADLDKILYSSDFEIPTKIDEIKSFEEICNDINDEKKSIIEKVIKNSSSTNRF